MEMEEGDWSSQSNWTIASGSLRDCITFQSSLSFVDDDEAATTTPLLLHPPSSDSAHCEIKINFTGKHELRQVYVRSTARVYEIYSAPNLRSNNDYLGTVRCGVAVRDGEVLRSPPIQDLTDDNIKNEDDWVEVKVPETPNFPSQTKPYINSTKSTQDLHEATAEFDGLNPCISVTLRLLSLQNKGCLYVDEIYVFADPVDSADSESEESRNENSSGSSLMAMFLPTLMQLSKTKGLGHLNDLRKEEHVSKDALEAIHPNDSVIKTQLKGKASITNSQEVKLNEVKGGCVGPSQSDTLSQVAKTDSNSAAIPSRAAKMDSTCSDAPTKIAELENNHSDVPFHIAKTECSHSAVTSQGAISKNNRGDSSGGIGNVERVLEQLVSRMDRIEEICLGFQEKMVMPMNSMEARLQQVEQQLDALTKKLQNSALPSCRISAPDASCVESDVNSCDNCLDYTATRESGPDKKIHTEVPHVFPHDMSDSANTIQLLPSLVVKAPEFPDGEDEEGNVSGQEMNISKDKSKQSIDDALSSALAKFLLSSMSSESPKYTKSLAVKAPEFSNEDDDDLESSNEIAKNDSVNVTDSEKFIHTQVLVSSEISLTSGEKVNTDSNDKCSEKTPQEAEEHDRNCSAEEDQDEVCVETGTSAEHNPRTGFSDNDEEDKNGKINGPKSGLSSNIGDISNELLDSQTPAGYSIPQNGPSARTELTVATEVPEKPIHDNIIENVLGFSLASSAVDFEIPLLDVKFISQRSPDTELFLQGLLVETKETSSGDPSAKESNDLFVKEQLKNNDVSVEQQSNLISIEDGELVNPANDSHFAADEDLCTSITAPVNIDGDNLPLPEDHKRKRDDSGLI